MQTKQPTPRELKEIALRRKWYLIVPFLAVFLIAVLTAFLLPPVYRSVSTILIEEQEIPANFVMATVTSFAEQRLQSINQRIMSSARLLEIINEYSLYEQYRSRWTTEEIIKQMREDIHMNTISADVIDRRTGRPTTAMIAFTLSYEGRDPEKVRKVADRLASLYLGENIRVREKRTRETSQFLESEMEKVKEDLAGIEAEISAFKEKHANELPELLVVNRQYLNTLTYNMERLTEQRRSLKNKQGYLTSQLKSLEKDLKRDRERTRIEELRTRLVNLKSTYSDQYPDVIRVAAELEKLEAEAESSPVVEAAPPDNPAYISLAAQLSAVKMEAASLDRQIKSCESVKNDYISRIEATHSIEGEYNHLCTRRDNTRAKYEDLLRKVMEANVAYGLEKEQKSERFTLIDPARYPEKPFKPDWVMILLIGLALGLASGVLAVAAAEISDGAVRGINRLQERFDIPVLATLPAIVTRHDRRIARRHRFFVAAGCLSTLCLALLVFHFAVMDLDVFMARVMRKFGV